MRQIVSTAVVAVIVSLLTLTVAGAVAQTGPGQDEIGPSAVVRNADKVDGKHAIRATAMLGLRAKKLVATDKQGFLPANIVRPLWHLVQNKPAGFADNIDNEGVTKIKTTTVVSAAKAIPGSGFGSHEVKCPPGSLVVGGGGWTGDFAGTTVMTDSTPRFGDTWRVYWKNNTAGAVNVVVEAVCLSVEPAGLLTPASKGKVEIAGKAK